MEVGIEGSIKQCLADSSPQDVIKQLIDGYSGYAQMSHIVSEWLAIATHIERGPAVAPAAPSSSHLSTGQRPSTNTSTDDPEATVVTHLAAMIKQRFDAATADAIIPRLKGTPEWLKRMMADETFRKMLIELYDQNRSSTLIRVSLKEISKMGHHREIAHVIPDLDYFEVFGDSEPLVDILVRVGVGVWVLRYLSLSRICVICTATAVVSIRSVDLLFALPLSPCHDYFSPLLTYLSSGLLHYCDCCACCVCCAVYAVTVPPHRCVSKKAKGSTSSSASSSACAATPSTCSSTPCPSSPKWTSGWGKK